MANRGNPNWGKTLTLPLALPTQFEREVKRLDLTKGELASSPELKRWCEQHRNRYYVPEWLLKEWRMSVSDTFSDAA